MSEVDKLAAQLDHVATWTIWRTWDLRWVVKVVKESQSETFDGDSLEEVLRAALDWRPLPKVPPRPVKLDLEVAKVRDGLWGARTNAGSFLWYAGTKKTATQRLEHYQARVDKAIEDWDRVHGHWLDKTPEIDFRWSD